MAAERIETSAGVPFTDEVRLDDVLADVGDDYRRKGLLFRRHVRALGAGFEALRPSLEAPPALGLYLPFHDYPTRDYLRVFDVVARRKHPGVASAQAWRLEARNELQGFLGQAIGRITWSLFDDPRGPLVRYPQLSRMVLTKPIGVPDVIDERRVRIEYQDPIGSLAYAVGVFEGIVLSFRQHPRVTVELDGPRTTFDVRWTV